MTDTDSYSPPSPEVARPRRWRPSLIWLVPIVAGLIGIALAVRAVLSAGTLIEIRFESAEGLKAGTTQVRYKDVVVGTVRGISLAKDLQSVSVLVELDRNASQLAVEDTRFWIVRPRIDTGGVSGLETLVSGVYISLDVGKSSESQRFFEGLPAAPAVTSDRKGTSFVLNAPSLGSLGAGSPVYYRRIPVGRVGAFEMKDDGSGVTLQIFVDAPYDRFVTRNARFWNASGIDISLSAGGLEVNTESLASVLAGGVAFLSPDEGEPAGAGTEFWLHDDRSSALAPPSGPPLRVRMRFVESLRGLEAGAPIDFRGVDFGKVDAIELEYDEKRGRFVGNVLARVYPWRLGTGYQSLRAATGNAQRLDSEILHQLVADGLRAQLRSGNLLTGQLYIALDFADKARLEDVEPLPESGVLYIPTEQGSLALLQTQIADIVEEFSDVPFADIGRDLRETIRSADALLKRLDGELAPEAAQTLAEARRALDAARSGVLASDSGLQQDLRQTLQEVERAGRSFRILADYLQRHPEALLSGKGDVDEPEAPESREGGE